MRAWVVALAASGASLRDPRALDAPPLVLGETAPDAAVLAGLECELEALRSDRALAARAFRFADLDERGTRVTDGKEELGIRIAAERVLAPRVIGASECEVHGGL